MVRQDPNPPSRPRDTLVDTLRKSAGQHPAGPEPIRPGDLGQLRRTIEKSDPVDLWLRPVVQQAVRGLAEYMQNWERARRRPNPAYDADYWMRFWGERFTTSVQYILYHREFRGTANRRAWHLAQLKAAEDAVIRQTPPTAQAGAVEAFRAVAFAQRIEAVRQAARTTWLSEVDRAVSAFLSLAENQSRFLTVKQQARPVLVKGLPTIVPVVKPEDAPGQLQKGSVGSARSVVTFVAALQRQWHGRAVKADNYTGHELGNPRVGPVEFLGKFSFDVDLASFVKVRDDGFYEHADVVDFFLAAERASTETNIGWLALYNDFAVAKEVNETIGEFRIGFSGGGSPLDAPPEKQGSLHHGPAPYLLHVHFNVMWRPAAAVLLHGKDARPVNLGFTGD